MRSVYTNKLYFLSITRICIIRLEKKEKLRKEREKQKEEDEVVEIKKEKKRVSQVVFSIIPTQHFSTCS